MLEGQKAAEACRANRVEQRLLALHSRFFFQLSGVSSFFEAGCSGSVKGPRLLVEDLLSALSTSDSEIYVALRV